VVSFVYSNAYNDGESEDGVFGLVVQTEVWPGRREQFLAGTAQNAKASVRDEPGCLRFDVCPVAGDENRTASTAGFTDAGVARTGG
jgi:autoinducer 2-degrading protein